MDTQPLTTNGDGAKTRTGPAVGLTVMIVGSAVAFGVALLGWWWAVPITGLLIAVVVRRARVALPIAVVCGAAGFAIALYVSASTSAIARIARVTASLAGLGHDSGAVVVVATIAYGAVLCAVGAWVGVAGRSLLEGSASPAVGQQPLAEPDRPVGPVVEPRLDTYTSEPETSVPTATETELVPAHATAGRGAPRSESSHDRA